MQTPAHFADLDFPHIAYIASCFKRAGVVMSWARLAKDDGDTHRATVLVQKARQETHNGIRARQLYRSMDPC